MEAGDLLRRGLDVRGQRVARRFEVPVLVAAILVVPAILIEALSTSSGLLLFAAVLNWVIWLVFAAEFLTLVSIAVDRGAYIRSAWLEIIIVVLTFPLLTALAEAAELAGLARLGRLARLTRFGAVMSRAGVVLTHIFRKRGLAYVAALTGTLAITFGVIFGLIEDGASVADGVWWAIVTITTVGYGDFFPATLAGRIVAGMLMVVGIGFVATLTATVAAYFVDEQEDDLRQEIQQLRAQLDELVGSVKAIEAVVSRSPEEA